MTKPEEIMQKIVIAISSAAMFALMTFSANACSFDEHSASLKNVTVASLATQTPKTSEAMSTFDPKQQPVFEVTEDAPEMPVVKKEITE